MEVRGSYEIRLSTTALAAILATGHPAVAAVQVQRRVNLWGDVRVCVPTLSLHVLISCGVSPSIIASSDSSLRVLALGICRWLPSR